MMDTSDQVTVISNDDKSFTILPAVAQMSRTLKNLIEAGAVGAIPCSDVNGKTLERVVEWCMKHKDDPAEAPTAAPGTAVTDAAAFADFKPAEISEDDKKMFEPLSQEALFEVILAANYLEIPKLLDTCCRITANSVLGKTPKEIYAQFGVEKELTPEEEEEVRKDNPWLEDN